MLVNNVLAELQSCVPDKTPLSQRNCMEIQIAENWQGSHEIHGGQLTFFVEALVFYICSFPHIPQC